MTPKMTANPIAAMKRSEIALRTLRVPRTKM
jgi:hypothetical protein